MNTVHLIGRVATDVEIKEVGGGSKVSSFILAVDRNAEEAEVAILRQCLRVDGQQAVQRVPSSLSPAGSVPPERPAILTERVSASA